MSLLDQLLCINKIILSQKEAPKNYISIFILISRLTDTDPQVSSKNLRDQQIRPNNVRLQEKSPFRLLRFDSLVPLRRIQPISFHIYCVFFFQATFAGRRSLRPSSLPSWKKPTGWTTGWWTVRPSGPGTSARNPTIGRWRPWRRTISATIMSPSRWTRINKSILCTNKVIQILTKILFFRLD